MTKTALLSLALLGSLAATGPASAAEQGALGASSKGEITIRVTVASRATMADLAADASATDHARSACVWIGTATHRYALTVLSGAARWRAAGGTAKDATVGTGQTLAGLVAPAVRPDCDHDATHLAAYDASVADPATPATLLIAPE